RCARRRYAGSRSGWERSACESVGAALDAETLRAPAQHAAGEIGDFLEARLAEEDGSLRRARPRAADGHHRLFLLQLLGAFHERAQGHETRAWDVAERAVEFIGLAHVDHLHVAQVLLEPVRLHFPDAAE